MGQLEIQRQDSERLTTGYSRTFRAVEVSSIIAFWGLCGAIALKVAPLVHAYLWLILAAGAFGFILADLVSGIVHWAADTWGSPEMPLLGKALIRPVRQHHVDQKAMTHHDYIETNGANCLISLPVAMASYLTPLDVEGWAAAVALFLVVSMTSMIFWVMMTNQIHKWSHLEAGETPLLVKWAQHRHLVLPPDHHQRHHTPPFDTYYCITTGWLNPPLHRIGFFRFLERLVMLTTDALPRRDDIGVVAATRTAPMVPRAPERHVPE